jgi:hypothetical protein
VGRGGARRPGLTAAARLQDGTTDTVWKVVSERTLEVARAFFDCPGLTALPLMGENPLGEHSRGSHWETRIMNDEFMAYGEGR